MLIEKLKYLINSLIFRFPSIYITHQPFKIYEFKDLIKGVQFQKTDIILDIGCGHGLQTLLLGKRCKKIYGIDVNRKGIATAKYRSQFVKRIKSEFRATRLENAEFNNEMFDKIYSFCVIEHISNYEEVLKEAYRILKINGNLLISVDSLGNIIDKNIIEYHQKSNYVAKYFDEDELHGILKDIGYKNIEIYSIFRSNYAVKLFVKGLYNEFIYGYFTSIFNYLILKHREMKNKGKKGLMLVVKCNK